MHRAAGGGTLCLIGRADQQLCDREAVAGEESAQGPLETQGQEGRPPKLSVDALDRQGGGGDPRDGFQNVPSTARWQIGVKFPIAIAG